MSTRLPPKDFDVKIKFGGGLHTRAPEDEIAEREATDGYNFLLDAENSDLRPRPAYDLLDTAPNAGSINGGGSYRQANGTVVAWIQAGDTVYEYDSNGIVASPTLDTVNSAAKLRGPWRNHTWDLDDKMLISDLALLEPVKEWDGTTWGDVSFRSNPSTAFGSSFYAKYITISDERVFYSNVKDGASALPQMIVGSERSDYEEISVDNRPSSSLGEADPFFLLTPDLRAINGFVEAFGTRVISTEKGRIFELAGDSAKDFSMREFFPGSAAAGNESLAYIGTDIMYGRQGRIESLRDTDTFGDTASDDISRDIKDQIENYTNWTTVYNSRLNRVYLFPDGGSEVWVYDTALRGTTEAEGGRPISPWMKWTTTHALAFQPTWVGSMLDPADGLEYVFMGDSSGNLYRLEGTAGQGDANTVTNQTVFLSKLFSLPLDMKAHNVDGYIKYRTSGSAYEVAIRMEYSGEQIADEPIVVSIPATTAWAYYGGGEYYGNSAYYGTAYIGRLTRQKIELPGGDSNEFQVRVTVTSNVNFDINEIGLKFRAAG